MKLAKKWLIVLAVAAMLPSTAMAYYYATTVTGICTFDCKFSESVTTGYPQPVSVTQEIQQTDNYSTSGTASGQVDTLYAKSFTLAASTPTAIDLTTLTDPAGNAINFARVREFVVQNTTATAGYDVKVYATGTNGWSPVPPSTSPLTVRYGSVFRMSDKFSTGAGNGNIVTSTSKSVTFDPGSNGPITINVMILGGSAALLPGFLLAFLGRSRRRAA